MRVELPSPRPPATDEAGVSDADLLARFVSDRDEAAFRALVRRHGGMVLAVCRRVLGHTHDAEDAFQVTFLLLSRRAGELARPDLLSSWLHGVAHRTALKQREQNGRRRQAEQHALPGVQPPASLELAWREVEQVLDEELQRLDESLRAPLVLCYLEGKSHQEAARSMGRPPGSMSWLVARALDALRARLVRRGVKLSAGLPLLLLMLRGREALCERLLELAAGGALLDQPAAAAVVDLARESLLARLLGHPFRRVATFALALALLTSLGVSAATSWIAQGLAPEISTRSGGHKCATKHHRP